MLCETMQEATIRNIKNKHPNKKAAKVPRLSPTVASVTTVAFVAFKYDIFLIEKKFFMLIATFHFV